MRQRTLAHSSSSPRRRGSILLLVLVLLALLVLMVTTLIYAARLETLAARSAVQSIQNRMEPASVVPNAVDILRGQLGQPTAFNQVWALGPRPPAVSGSTNAAAASVTKATSGTLAAAWTQVSPTGTRWPGWLEITDQSALLNINTVAPYPRDSGYAGPLKPGILPAQVLERLIAQRLGAAGYKPSEAVPITRLILSLRWEAANEPVEPESPWNPSQDASPFISLDSVRVLTGMSKPVFDAIAPFLTTFSCSCDLWRAEDGAAYELASANTLEPEGILQVLKRVYPDAPEDLLRQFALNIVDRRDPDSVPTPWPGATGGAPLIGFELTPLISEVCPDVITFAEDGDNGEYIEIYNPLPEAADLRGWRIDWGPASHVLNAALAPGAFLVLTDDIRNEHDPTPEDNSPGMGSFADVFGLPVLGRNQIEEEPAMDIPDEQGLIRLFDAQGNLVDYLTYRGGTFNGLERGFHKRNVFSHVGESGPATPFAARLEDLSDPYEQECWRTLLSAMDTPYTNAVELLMVPCFSETPGSPLRLQNGVFPLFEISTGPDLRLVDVFTAAERADAAPAGDLPRPWGSLGKPGDKTSDAGLSAARSSLPPGPVVFGRVNLNTAPTEVLLSLPGLDPEAVALIASYRTQAQSPALIPSTADAKTVMVRPGAIPFHSLSDFANNSLVWGKRNAVQRLQALFALAPYATFNSTSFRARSTGAAASESGVPSQTGVGSQAFIVLSESGVGVLDWRFRFPGQEESLAGGRAN